MGTLVTVHAQSCCHTDFTAQTRERAAAMHTDYHMAREYRRARRQNQPHVLANLIFGRTDLVVAS
jgi:hypothetical protein